MLVTQNRAPPLPIDAAEFAALMEAFTPFENSPSLLVAVSGGSDSMALLQLCSDWVKPLSGRVIAATIDHGLRPESATEARTVFDFCQALGVSHHTLCLTVDLATPPASAELRKLRYDRLAALAEQLGLLHLLLGHHLEDQSETYLTRLARSSGEDGLAAMAATVYSRQLRLLRPFLTISKARLQATCAHHQIVWCEDPSNSNPRYLRAQLRAQQPERDQVGDTAITHAAKAAAWREIRQSRENQVTQFLAQHLSYHEGGWVQLPRFPVQAAPDYLQERILLRLLRLVRGVSDYPPRRERLLRLVSSLDQKADWTQCLFGCTVVANQKRLLIYREPAAMSAPIALSANPKGGDWDGRFRLSVFGIDDNANGANGWLDQSYFGALTATGVVMLRRHGWRDSSVPKRLLPTIPCLFTQSRDHYQPLWVPALGYCNPSIAVRINTSHWRISALAR